MSGLKGIIHGATMIGLPNSLRAVGNAWARDRADKALEPRPTIPHREPGDLRGAAIEASGVRIRFATTFADLTFPRQGQVSVGWQGALDEPSYAVVAGAADRADDRADLPPVLEQTDGGWIVRGPGIAVHVARDGAMTYLDAQGRTRRQDQAPAWDGVGWTLRTALPEGATLHGLGGRTVWDLRGATYRCWNTDPGGAWLPGRDPLYVTTPVYAVLDDIGATHCFIDNACDATIDATGSDLVAHFEGGPLRLHVSIGSLPQALDAYTALTGRPTPQPRWALGHHQARWGYGSTEAVRAVWHGFAENDLPLSAMHLDIDHMEGFRNFTFGTEHWAGIGDLIAEMAAEGVRTVVIVDAGTAKDDGYPVYREGIERGLFCANADGSTFEGVVWPGPTVFPDFTSAEARRWWGEQFAFYADLGVAGYWHDMNEPSNFAAWGDPTFPLSTRHDLDGRPSDHRDVHNIYGLQMCRASYEGLRDLRPDDRPFLFSGPAGQACSATAGTGAGTSRRHGRRCEPPCTRPSGTASAGWATSARTSAASPAGRHRNCSHGGSSSPPSCRSSGPTARWNVPPGEPWEWGPEVMDRPAQRAAAALPAAAALVLARPGIRRRPAPRSCGPWRGRIRRCAGADDVFLLGEDVLVAPVLEEGATRRRVSLPEGVWFHGDTGERVEGSIDVPVGPDDIPWFVRSGAVIPTEEDGRLVLLVAPPEGDRHRRRTVAHGLRGRLGRPARGALHECADRR